MPTVHRITIYSKPDCHLCDLAKDVIDRVRQKCDFSIEVIDITTNEHLKSLYGNDIPVVMLDGQEIARHFVRERNLLDLLGKP